MTPCAACGEPLPPSDRRPAVRAGGEVYHVSCAPSSLIESASEEYRAVIRKGVRYFVEKYGDAPAENADVGARFLELGHAIESERERRGRG
jgi:hypothetical protein